MRRRLIAAAWIGCVVAACGTKLIDHGQTTSGQSGDGADADLGDGPAADSPIWTDCRHSKWPSDSGGYPPACPPMADTGQVELVACAACVCESSCGSDDECPKPATGTAIPECLHPNAICVLRCDAGQFCPEGMQCVSDGSLPVTMCAWPQTDDLLCFALEDGHDDPCAEYDTPEACTAIASENADIRCDWVTRTTLSTGSEDCQAAIVEEACVAVQAAVDCAAAAACPGGSGVFWRDLGAGTVELVEVSDCSWRPFEPLETCDLSGAVPIPLVCACACAADDPTGGIAAEGGDCPCAGG